MKAISDPELQVKVRRVQKLTQWTHKTKLRLNVDKSMCIKFSLFFCLMMSIKMNKRRDNRETNVKDRERERQSVFTSLILLQWFFLRAPKNLASPATLMLLMCLDSSP